MLGVRATVRFIDQRQRMIDRIEREEERALKRTGGYGAKVLRSGFLRRKRKSYKGETPTAHAPGSSGLKYGRKWAIPEKGCVMIGPEPYPSRRLSFKPGPKLLNEGGPMRQGQGPQYMRPRPYIIRTLNKTLPFFRQRIAELDSRFGKVRP